MEYELTYSGSNLPLEGPFVANGKIGIICGGKNEGISANRVFISKNVDFKNGQYQPNTTDVFNAFGAEFFAPEFMTPSIITNTYHSLNMDTAIATQIYNISSDPDAIASESNMPPNFVFDDFGNYVIADENSNIAVGSASFACDVTTHTYAVRHMPYTTIQTFECSNVSSSNLRYLHECWTRDNIIDATYENIVKYTGGDFPLHILVGHGKTLDGTRVAFASGYLFEGTTQVKPMGIGTNLQSTKRNFQFNCFDLTSAQNAYKFHVLTTYITENDFDDPRSEAIRITTSLCSVSPVAVTPQAIAAHIRGRHVDAWGKLWATKVRITPKIDATLEQSQEVRIMNTYLYSALYHIYCCVRENFNVDSNPNAIPVLDMDGSLLYEADMWLVPLLLLLKPEMAKTIIEYRHASLQLAKQLAASYGYEGAKIPYIDDIIGYKNNLYYNTSAYAYLFNTCMVAINTWNYYRMSRDKDWLRNKGYEILKEIANYLASVVFYDEETGEIALKNTVGLNPKASDQDNTFTMNLVKLALKYATEATYEMNYNLPPQWLEIFNGLEFGFYPSTRILRFDAASLLEDKFNVLEMLHVFIPGFWENFSRNNTTQFADLARNNYNFYDSQRLNPGEFQRPVNQMLRAITAGVVMSTDGTYLPNFMSHVQEFITYNISGPWLHMRVDVRNLNRRPQGLPFELMNSLTTNAMFLQMILCGILQMRLIGGISDTRFYYQDLKVAYATTATMPPYWAFVSVTNYGTGSNKGTLDVRQNVYDVTYVPPNAGGTFLAYGDFSVFTP